MPTVERGQYDGDLQMFVEPIGKLNLGRLRFLRWLVETKQMEHPVAGKPVGEMSIVDLMVPDRRRA